MNAAGTKRLTAAALFGVCLFAVLAFVFIVGQAEESVIERRQVEDVFTPSAELPAPLLDALRWAPDAEDLPRPIEPVTREDLGASWLRAFEQLAIVSRTGITDGVAEYWSGPALLAVQSADWSTMTTQQLGHELKVTFNSADGQVVGLQSESMIRRRYIGPEGVRAWEGTEWIQAVLVLRDGNWRVENFQRTGLDGEWFDD